MILMIPMPHDPHDPPGRRFDQRGAEGTEVASEAPKAPRSYKRGAEGAEVVSEAPKAPRIELLHPRVSCCILM